MKEPTVYKIRVEGHLPDHWSAWFEGLVIHNEPGGGATLTGLLADQSALMGILNRITTLNITLVSVIKDPYAKDASDSQDDYSHCR